MHLFIYLLCAVGVFVLNVFSDAYTAYVLDCVFIAVSVLSLVISVILRRGVEFNFEGEHRIAPRGGKCTVKIAVTNRTALLLTYCVIKLQVKTLGNRRKERKRPVKRKVRAMCPPRGTGICEFTVKCPHCENMQIVMRKAYTFDFLRIFGFGRKIGKTCDIIVEPKLPDIEVIDRMSAEIGDGENEIYSPNRPGDDPTEIFAIREYEGGDKIRNIHWKLSSKTGNLMVKDYGLPLRDNDTVVIDIFAGNMKKNKFRMMRDSVFDLLYGLINALTKRGTGFNVCYYADSYVTARIETQNDIYNLFVQLYRIIPYGNDTSCAQLFYAQNRDIAKRRIYYVTPFYDDNAVGNMNVLGEKGIVYYLIPGQVRDSRMPVRFNR